MNCVFFLESFSDNPSPSSAVACYGGRATRGGEFKGCHHVEAKPLAKTDHVGA